MSLQTISFVDTGASKEEDIKVKADSGWFGNIMGKVRDVDNIIIDYIFDSKVFDLISDGHDMDYDGAIEIAKSLMLVGYWTDRDDIKLKYNFCITILLTNHHTILGNASFINWSYPGMETAESEMREFFIHTEEFILSHNNLAKKNSQELDIASSAEKHRFIIVNEDTYKSTSDWKCLRSKDQKYNCSKVKRLLMEKTLSQSFFECIEKRQHNTI